MPETQQQEKPIYKTLIGQRVKLPNGHYVDLQPGESIPPGVVESWPDPQTLFKRKHFARIDGANIDPGMRGKYQPPRALTDEDLERRLPPAPPRPGQAYEAIGPGKDQVSVAIDPPDHELDAEPTKVTPASAAKIAELQSMTRRDLINFAAKSNVHIAGNESKDALIGTLVASLGQR